ncbi:unnamed protein product [Microthlaspi erraticum]|uniref:Uncharacterized protein n=1 Tax=Microthlaspi erraticum TaxID=1685480 RepID=A0A6D2I764_9BRAS|nr:unnamed protein product [Microthlaspi erraticum]
MDFIKTSSLRALIELTFQRNWNGLIWMSRKGVITKRVKTVQTALSRTAPNRAVRLAEERMFRARPNSSVRLKSRPKSKTTRPITHHDPGNCPRSATPQRHATRARPKRASREVSLAAAQLLPYHARTLRPTRENVPRPAEISSAKLHPPTTPTDRESVRPRPFRLGHDPTVRPIVPTDRPNAAVDPKPFLKPKLMFSSPA